MWAEEGFYKGLDLFASRDLAGAARIRFSDKDLGILRSGQADGQALNIPDWVLNDYIDGGYVNLSLAVQSINVGYAEISRVEEHIGDSASVYFYGRSPMILSVSAILFNDYANQSKHGLINLYRYVLRLTAVARTKAVPCLEFVGATAKGAFLGLNIDQSSGSEDTLSVSFQFLVFNLAWVNEENIGSEKKVRSADIAYNMPAKLEDLTIPPVVAPVGYTYVEPPPDPVSTSTDEAGTADAEPASSTYEETDTMAKNVPTVFDRQEVKEQLALHEGERLTPYYDTEGHLTVGIGWNLDANPTTPIIGREIGPGDTITKAESQKLFDHSLNKAISQCNANIPGFTSLSGARQAVLIDMTFNMGIGKPGESGVLGFPAMIDAVKKGDFDKAADEMVDSAWYGQVKSRAPRLVTMMRKDKTFSEMKA